MDPPEYVMFQGLSISQTFILKQRQREGIVDTMAPMPKGIPIPPDEIHVILETFMDCRKRGMMITAAYERVGTLVSRDPKLIGQIIARYRPTTDLAKMYFKAKALKMARRIVKKGTTAELINVLERPSIGVLDGVKKATDSTGGFFISVSADSCGAVKVGAGVVNTQLAGETEETVEFDPFADFAQSLEKRNDYALGGDHGENRDATVAGDGDAAHEDRGAVSQVVQRVRERLAEARRRTG